VEVHPALRARRRQFTRWALGRGLPLHRDALAALIGARSFLSDELPVDGGTESWSTAEVGTLLWVGIADWCQDRDAGLPDPDAVAATFLTYLRFLSAHRLLARSSDPVAGLRRAVSEFGGGGRSRRHPSLASRRPAPVVPIA
jgi:hypothetical protein